MADNDVILSVGGKVDASSFVKAGQEGSKLAQQGFKSVRVSADFSSITKGAQSAVGSFNSLSKSSTDFSNNIEVGLRRITALGAASAALFGIARAFEASITAARNLEASLKDINVILNLPTDRLQDFGKQLFDVARQTKQSFSEVAKSAQEFSRQGLDATQTIERTRAALLLSNLASIDAVKATSTITAAVNSFSKENLKAIDIVNKLVSVDAKFAVSSADLAEALTRVGSTAQEAGVGFDKLIALVTGAQQVSQRGGSVIGNALNTIFTRLKREDTLDALEQLGVQVREVESETGRLTGALVPADRVLSQLGEKFKTLTQEQRASTAETVAGVRQLNVLTSLFAGLGIAQDAYTTSVKASDEAIRRQSELLLTQDARIKNLGTSFQELGANLTNVGLGDTINKALKGLTEGQGGNFGANLAGQLIKAFSGTGDAVGNEFAKVFIKTISDVITGPGLVAIGLIGAKLATVLGKFAGQQLKQVNPFGNQEDAQLQKNIDNILSSQFEKVSAILKTETDRAVAEQRILDILRKENVLLVENAAISARAAAILGGTQAKSIISGRPIKNAANGIADAVFREQSAISKGIGGASSSAKPALIQNFNGGAAVANTDEYLVKNYAGRGSDAIFNQEMVKKYGIPKNAIKIGGASDISKTSNSDVLKQTSAPIGKLLASGKFTEEQLLKFLDIRNLFNGFIKNYAEAQSTTDREVALGSTLSIPLQRQAYPSQIIPQRGQTKRVADKLLGLGLSRKEVTEFLTKFRSGRSSAQPFEQGRGKTPFLIHDEVFGKKDFLSMYVTPKEVIPNYATGNKLRLGKFGIIQRELPNGELARPSPEFLEEAHKYYRRSQIEDILRTFETQGTRLTENKFLELAKASGGGLGFGKGNLASGYVPNLATGDEALGFIQNIIRELSTGAKRLALENKVPFAQNQLATIPPVIPRPKIPNINFGIPPSIPTAPEQLLLSAPKQPLRLETGVNPAANRLFAAQNRGVQSASGSRVFPGITSTQTNATLSPQLFAGQEQERLKLQSINQRQFLSQQPKPFSPLEGKSFNVEASRREAQNALFRAGIEESVRSINGLNKDLIDSSSVLKKMINASTKLQEQYISGEKTQSEFNRVSSRLNTSLQNEVKRLKTPEAQASLAPTFGQKIVNRLGGRENIQAKAGTAAFVLPFLAEGISSVATGGIQDPIEKARAQRGFSTASTGLSTAAFVASIAPNPVGLGVAGALGIGSVIKGIKEATTESDEDRAQKFNNFVRGLEQQQTAVQGARKAILDFQNALEDTTTTEKQRLSFQREALSAVRNVEDPRVASTLKQQVLTGNFSGQNQNNIEEVLRDAFKRQEESITRNQDNLTLIFNKAFGESAGKKELSFGGGNIVNNLLGARSITTSQGFSNETSTAITRLIESDVQSRKTPQEQAGRLEELSRNNKAALDTIGTFRGVLNSKNNLGEGAFETLSKTISEALTPEQRASQVERLSNLREGSTGDLEGTLKFFSALLTENGRAVKGLTDENKAAASSVSELGRITNFTKDTIKALGEFTLQDIKRSGDLDIAKNQRLISQSGGLQVAKNFGVGSNEIQFKEFSDNIANATSDAARQELEVTRDLSSQIIKEFFSGKNASTTVTALGGSPKDFSDTRSRFGNITNLQDFEEEFSKLDSAFKDASKGSADSAKSLQEIGNVAKQNAERISTSTRVEIERNRALEQQAIIINRLNPNKAEAVGAIGQQVNQSRFLTGLAPQTREEIGQADKEKLDSLNNLFNFVKGLGTKISPELEQNRGDLAKRVALSDINTAQSRLTDIPLSLEQKGLARDALEASKKEIEGRTGKEILDLQETSPSVSKLSDIVKEINDGELVKRISDLSANGIKLNYGGESIPVNGQISFSLNQEQVDVLSKNIFDGVVSQFNNSLQDIQATLDANAENFKTLNKEAGVTMPPIAQK